MPTAPINGIDIYYEVQGSGPALLFAHGQGGNHLSWWQQVPFFAKHYTCITYDARAFGFSHDRDGLGRTSFGADVIGLLDHLHIDDVRVIAHSMGGRSAIAVALRAPERCKAVIFAGTNGGVSDEAIRQRQREAAEARGDRGLAAFSVEPSYRQTHPEQYFLLRAISRLNPARPRDFLRPPTPNPNGNPQGGRYGGPIHERLQATGTPVLYIIGEYDLISPADMIKLCHEKVPGSRYVVIPGSGHSAYWEKPAFFNETVLAFLQSVDNPPPSTSK